MIATKVIVTLMALTIAVASVYGQSSSRAPTASSSVDEFHQVGPSKGFWPTVTVDKKDNKSDTSVHVPIFFDMQNTKDNSTGKHKLDLSVLGGLVTVNRDKERSPDGSVSGPLTVTVFGIPVYTGAGSPKSAFEGPSGIGDITRERASEVLQKSNDKLTNIVNDFSSRISSLLSSRKAIPTASPLVSHPQTDSSSRPSASPQTANASV